MRYSQRTQPIPPTTVAALSALPIRRLHRLARKHGLLPETYTEFLFRKVWRGKMATPPELAMFEQLRALVAVQPAEPSQEQISG